MHVAEHRERYTALLATLEELSTRTPMSTLAEIAAQLREVGYHDPLTDVELRDALDQLKKWEFAEPFRDYAAPVRSLQGFTGRTESWTLTRRGRGIVAAVRTAVVDAKRALQLPSRLLDGVERTIRDLINHFGSDPGMLPANLDDVRTRIDELQRVTADFYSALAQLIQSDVTDDVLFGENRDRVVEALRQFPQEYGRALRRVGRALDDLNRAGYRPIVEAAVEHAGLIDPGDQQSWVDERVRRVADLAAWFRPEGTIRNLIASATGAVNTLLVAIDRRYTARRRGIDLAADFRAIARSLHSQPTDTEARRVYAAAFGDWPAWHAVVGSSDEDVAHGTAASAGTTRHTVEVTLREHERQGRVAGRPRKLANTEASRAAAFEEAYADANRRKELSAHLMTDGDVDLAHFAHLPADATTILLRAIEVAVGQIDSSTGWGRAYADGAPVIVEVRYVPGGQTVSVPLAGGRLTGPDLRVRVMPAHEGDTDTGRIIRSVS
jgi:uncharacterized protein (TIGR02677 family)